VKYELIGSPPTIAVPTHFFKVVLAHDGPTVAMAAFIFPNEAVKDPRPLITYLAPLDDIEKTIGVTFFEGVDRTALVPLCSHTQCVLPAATFSKAKPHEKTSFTKTTESNAT
jgi:endonuclease G